MQGDHGAIVHKDMEHTTLAAYLGKQIERQHTLNFAALGVSHENNLM